MEECEEQRASSCDASPSRIAALNDALRRTGRGGRVVLTNGVLAKGVRFTALALTALGRFTAFTPSNDPHGEHDCALIEVEGTTVFWKIDYYDTALTAH